MCPFRARALEKDFPYGEQPRQRRPGLKKPKRQMPSCRTQLANLRASRGACAPCGLRVPTRKVTRPSLIGAPSTRKLARPPGRRRPVWPPRPNPQSYTARPHRRALNSQTCAPPGAPAPRVASASQPAKLHGQASSARPQLANLRAPRGAGAPCGLRVPTRKVTRPSLMGAPSTRNLARPPGAPAPRVASASQHEKLHPPDNRSVRSPKGVAF